MTPKPLGITQQEIYRNGSTWIRDLPRLMQIGTISRDFEIDCIRADFALNLETPDYVLKDILLENGFTDYCELLFPEVKL